MRLDINLALAPLMATFVCIASPSCGRDTIDAPVAVAGALTPSTPMRIARSLHTATRLLDGRVLIVGGGTPASNDAGAELFDPATQTSRAIPMSFFRQGHTATLLANGTVLIVGGSWGDAPAARTAELFDPATERFRATGAPVDGRADHAAVVLRSGKVLIVGGDLSGVGSGATATAELYDPATGTFSTTGSMLAPRRPYGVLLMADGTVLVPGGTSTGKSVIAEAEVYDATTGTFTRTGALRAAREKHTASLLRDGTVLVIGGSNPSIGADRLTSSEVYDPRTRTFSDGPTLHGARHKFVSIAMADGSVLVAGGGASLAEVYDAATKQFNTVPGSQDLERFFPAVSSIGDNRFLISGGYDGSGSQRATWIFQP